jgi:hypothetical protein
MGETPRAAEQNFVNLMEMSKVRLDQNLWAYEIMADGSATYIVFDHGTKYTTSIRPAQIPQERVIPIAASPAGDNLRNRLRARANALREVSTGIFEAAQIGATLDSVDFLYSEAAKGPHYRHIEAVKGIGEFLELNNEEAIRNWCTRCIDRLIESYGSYLLAGDEVIKPVATLLLFDFCPFPLSALLEMNRDYLRYGVGQTVMGVNVSMPFPVPDIKFYLEHPAVPANVAVVWGTAIAREFQNKAEVYRDHAKTRFTVEQFLAGLYLALVYYRCALYAFRAVLSLKKAKAVTSETAKSRIDEAPTEADLCEEYRVVIAASLHAASEGSASRLVNMPSIANAIQFSSWVDWMASPTSQVNAEIEIRQAYDAQLVMPTFLRDLAIGRITCIKGEATKGLAKLQAVTRELEKHLREAVILGDPNYLSSTYDFMAKVCESHGMENAEYLRRAQPAYVQALLDLAPSSPEE